MTTSIMYKKGPLIISADTNYQGYTYDTEKKVCTPTNHRTAPKWETVRGIWPSIIPGNSFMDIGASMGFFCFKAVEHGASKSIGIESHGDYFNAVKSVCGDIIDYHQCRFPAINGLSADVVMALSIVHHLLQSHGIETVAQQLADVTKKALIVEWIGVDDRTQAKYGYGENHKWEKMQAVLEQSFADIQFVGFGHHETRKIYLCQK